jgi:hypothetical protein
MHANMNRLHGESQVMARQIETYREEMCSKDKAYHNMQGLAAEKLHECVHAHELAEQQLRHAVRTGERAEENATYWRHISNSLQEKLHAESEAYARNRSPDDEGTPSPPRLEPPSPPRPKLVRTSS